MTYTRCSWFSEISGIADSLELRGAGPAGRALRTVLPEGLMQWAQRQWAGRPGLRRVDLCITGGGALFLHEGGLLPQARCESGRPMAEGPSPGPHDGQG